MPRDGTGGHTNPFPNFVPGTASNADDVDANFADISAALTASMAKDGQTTPTANLPMGNLKHTAVAAATARTEYARAAEVQDGAMVWATVGGTGDVITLATSFGPAAYTAGQVIKFKATAANTTAVTVNWNALGAKALKSASGATLTANAIIIGDMLEITYDGIDFRDSRSAAAAAAGGKVAQVVNVGWGTQVTFTELTPFDNTIPQITEGAERISANFIPTNAGSTLYIEVTLNCTIRGGTVDTFQTIIAHLHRDVTANAIAVGMVQAGGAIGTAGGAKVSSQLVLRAAVAAVSTAATQFKVRSGRDLGGGTMTASHNGDVALFGGTTLLSSITITEVLP